MLAWGFNTAVWSAGGGAHVVNPVGIENSVEDFRFSPSRLTVLAVQTAGETQSALLVPCPLIRSIIVGTS